MSNEHIPLFKVFMPENAKTKMGRVLDSGFLAEGPMVEEFSKRIGNFIGNHRVVPVNSCTTALSIAFKLAGVGPGTEVISTPLTCVAGNEPVAMLGGTLVWADVEKETGMLSAAKIAPLITPRTKAIYLLHKEGSPAPLEDIYTLAKNYNIKIIEDAAHAFGVKRGDTKIGQTGDFVCFSFQAIKHITTGDGGALFCGNEDDYQKAKKAKWFGIDRSARKGRDVWREDIPDWGFKGNMNDIAGALGLAQMDSIDWILNRFHENGRRYDEIFETIPGVTVLNRNPKDFQTYWGYTILIEDRPAVMKALQEANIGCGQIHVRNDHYSMFKSISGSLPNTDWFDARELSLPCGWWIDNDIQDRIIDVVERSV